MDRGLEWPLQGSQLSQDDSQGLISLDLTKTLAPLPPSFGFPPNVKDMLSALWNQISTTTYSLEQAENLMQKIRATPQIKGIVRTSPHLKPVR